MYSREEELARRRVKKKKGFYTHLAVYVIVNAFIFLVNLPGSLWSLDFGPALPWGIGLAFHYLAVFGFPGSGVLSKDWEEREYERELEKMGRKPLPPLKKPTEKNDELELPEMKKKLDERDLV